MKTKDIDNISECIEIFIARLNDKYERKILLK